MTTVRYERWAQFAADAEVHPVVRAIRAAGLDALLADDLAEPAFAVDATATLVSHTPALATLLGREPIVGSPVAEWVVASHARRVEAALATALEGDGVRLAAGLTTADGEREWLWSLIPVREPGQVAPIGVLVTLRSVTGAAASDAERSARLLALAGRVAGFAGWSLDVRSGALTFTEEGLPRAAVAAGHLQSLDDLLAALPPAQSAQFSRQLARTTSEGRSIDLELDLALARLDPMRVRVVGEPVRDAGGTVTTVSGAIHDLTEYRRQEQALRRAQRLERIGAVAGGIAHDLGNVLTPILLSAQLLADAVTDERDAEALAMIEAAARRGTDMVQQVLSFSRGVEGRHDPVDVGALLDELLRFARTAVPDSISVRVDREGDLPPILGDSTQLLQVLTNLVVNARDAMPAGGMITVRARTTAPGELVGPLGESSPWLVIEVEDTGTGMSEMVFDQLFEPFFTTKGEGRGTGLGLATSLTIARGHGGDLRADSDGRTGSTMSLLLPVRADQPVTGDPASLERGS